MGFGEAVVHFESSLRRFLGGWESLLWREHSVKTKCAIGIRNTDVGFRKHRVQSNCLAEVFQALLQPLVRSLVPEITSLDVGLIGIWSLRGALSKPAALFPRQFQADGLGNALRERVLQGKDVREFLVEGFAPKLHAVAHTDKLYGETNVIGLSLNASVENSIDALLLTSRLRAQIRSSIFLNGAGRSYDDLPGVSKPSDQCVSHLQAEVFFAALRAQGLERKDGN